MFTGSIKEVLSAEEISLKEVEENPGT